MRPETNKPQNLWPNRFASQLLLSHSVPVVAVSLAFGLTLTTLIQISVILTDLTGTSLVTWRDEEELHRSTWSVDVALRRAQNSCLLGRVSETTVVQNVELAARELEKVAATVRARASSALAPRYIELTRMLKEPNACAILLAPELEATRAQLNEELTQTWSDRRAELLAEVTEKDEHAQRLAVSAMGVGIPLALAALLLALLIARRVASVVTRPLASLVVVARRVGQGDLNSPVSACGPSEVLLLAEALERMRLRLRQVATMKENFLASVSHELRTPLSKIREALTLLEDGAVGQYDPRMSRVLGIARTACEHEIHMVTTLLDISRLRAGNPVQARHDASVDAALQSALKTEQAEAEANGVVLEWAAYGAEPRCLMDPALVERALANLVRNAVAVSPEAQRVRVERTVEHDPPGRDGPWIKISVTDHGPGVPDQVRDTLFDPFVTCAVPDTDKRGSVGLGLAFAREVAEAHGGALDLASSGESGATFCLWLPATIPEYAKPRPIGTNAGAAAVNARIPTT